MLPPIIICSTKGTCLPVLMASIEEYVPVEVEVYLFQKKSRIFNSEKGRLIYHCGNHGSSFGESYNMAVDTVLSDGYDSVVIANDDIVLTPTSWSLMMADVEALKDTKVGWIGIRSDFARRQQNYALMPSDKYMPTDIISPYLGWISKEAWEHGRFPNISYFSDDISSVQLAEAGYQNYVSSGYSHHVGAQTCKEGAEKHVLESIAWIKQNRPDLYKLWDLNR